MPMGVIHLLWQAGVAIEESDAQAAMAAVNQAAQGSEYPLLVDMAATASVSREARAVFSIPCAATRALVGTSPVDRVLANFFLRVHIPPCPATRQRQQLIASGPQRSPGHSVCPEGRRATPTAGNDRTILDSWIRSGKKGEI